VGRRTSNIVGDILLEETPDIAMRMADATEALQRELIDRMTALDWLAQVRLQRHKFPARANGGLSPAFVGERLHSFPQHWFGNATGLWKFKQAIEVYVSQVTGNLRTELMDAIAAARAPSAPALPAAQLRAAVQDALSSLSAEVAGLRAQLVEMERLGRMVEAKRHELQQLNAALAAIR
jgi:hypothetical protein